MLKRSKQRDEILKILSTKNFHPSADEIYFMAKKKLPGVGIATIYRNLEQLSRLGEITKIDLPGGAACYDGNTVKHYHILCTECSKLTDVWLEHDIAHHIDYKKTMPGYTVTEYEIKFKGICKDCYSSNSVI